MAGFWVRWTAATLVGAIVGFIGSFTAVDVLVGPEGPESIGVPFEVAFPVVVGLTGVAMGTLQWLVIRRRGTSGRAWVAATGGGLLFATLVIVQLPEGATLGGALLWGALHAVVVGVVVGSLQWLAIQRLDPTRRWLLASVAGWLAAGVVGDAVAWYSDGGIGMITIFLLWAALTAPVVHRLTTAGTRPPAASVTASA
jgi:hypothetical protein